MRIGNIVRDGRLRVAAFTEDAAVDLATAFAAAGGRAAPNSVIEIIENTGAWTRGISQAVASGEGRISLDRAILARPILHPGKVVCLALNNSANRDRILSGPDHPALFIKPASCLIGGGEAIVLRPEYGRVHPEPELAVVVGRNGRDIPADRAYEYVFGYTVLNDLTSPTMRSEDTFHYRAIHPAAKGGSKYVETWVSYPGRYKGSDTFGPIGPWIVSRDEIADPHGLAIQCLHQGRVVTEDSTANLTHKVPEVIAFVSRYMTLFPGDIISLGTALKASSGGAPVQTIDLNALGGPIAISISGIGTLENPVSREP